ncbi:MAG: polysaccharide deacetylase family protein [candidate division FCPU426 bacterium]
MALKHLLVFLWTLTALAQGAADLTPPAPGPVAPPAAPLSGLPVLCYHRFGEEDGIDKLKISGEHFAEELAWLKEQGYQSVTLEQAAQFLEGKTQGLPEHPVMLTIDDGYRSGWQIAGPVLQSYGFKAVYFLIEGQLELTPSFLAWSDVRELLAAGHQVGSHTLRHSNLAKPLRSEESRDYARRLDTELQESRRRLERRLGLTLTALAYPYGAFNPVVEAAALKAGYGTLFTATSGINLAGEGRHSVNRFVVMGPPSLESFKRKIHERRLGAGLDGMANGEGFYASQLPRTVLIRMPAGELDAEPRVELQGFRRKIERARDPGTWTLTLPQGLRPRFYYLKIEAGASPDIRRDRFLFQVYKDAWKGWFQTEGEDDVALVP